MSGQRYVQRVGGAFIDAISVSSTSDFNWGGTQIVALNASGFIDPSLLHSLGGTGVTSVNSITGAVVISGGANVSVTESGQTVLISVNGGVGASGGVGSIGFILDGGANAPSLGQTNKQLVLNYNAQIIGWSVMANASGASANVDVDFKSGSAPPSPPTFPNNTTDKISSSAPITLSSGSSAAGGASAISSWSTSLTQWGTVNINLSSVSNCTVLIIQIFVTKI